jgi:hypothetical protein
LECGGGTNQPVFHSILMHVVQASEIWFLEGQSRIPEVVPNLAPFTRTEAASSRASLKKRRHDTQQITKMEAKFVDARS